jgi:hypothetical protein
VSFVLEVMLSAGNLSEENKCYEHNHQLNTEEKNCRWANHLFNFLVFIVVIRFVLNKRCDVNWKANDDLEKRQNTKDFQSFSFLFPEVVPSHNKLVEARVFSLKFYHAFKQIPLQRLNRSYETAETYSSSFNQSF